MADREVDRPFSWSPEVRDSCVKMVSLIGVLNADDRELITQKDDWIINTIRVFIIKNMELVGKRVLYM